jgi:hypothetical protein
VIAAAPPRPFVRQVAGGVAGAFVLFLVPGLLALRGRRLCFAPALGVCLGGAPLMTLTLLLGFNGFVVLLGWAVALGVAWWWGRGVPVDAEAGEWRVLVLAGALATFVVLDVLPWSAGDRTYHMAEAYDHSKVAMIDSMVREGTPPRNPYISPNGEAIPLVYYFGTQALAAALCEATGIPGWPGSAAITWYAAFAFVTLCAGWAMRWGGAGAGKWAVLACLLAAPEWSLRPAFGPLGPKVIEAPSNDMFGLGTFVDQANWAPHHVMAAVGVVTALWVLVRYAEGELAFPRATAVFAGGLAICAASSTWVAFAVVLAAPCVLVATRGRGAGPALAGAALAALLASPVLAAIASQPAEVPMERFPIGLRVLDASKLAGDSWLLNIPLYWVQFLPVRLGVCYVAGLIALWAGRRSLDGRVALFTVLAGLVMAQFVVSQIRNNDLGWRGLLPAILLLNARAAAWRSNAAPGHARAWWVAGVVLGLVSVIASQSFVARPWKDPHKQAVGRAFAQQPAAWEAVRRHAGPHELVVNNHNSYNAMVWLNGGNVNWALLADRPSAMSGGEHPHASTFRRDPAAMETAFRLIDTLFFASEHAAEAARGIRDTLKAKVLLLDRLDPVWPGEPIERSGAWRLVEETEHWKVYVARDP